ncbi:MAG: hypothetical protein A3A85_02225 [Deltaproteobacteria bacterium RIFCSPLOWO2_01_FULL_42_9]|nr:MAG: hypothetical protein A3A85_02225 [Deltaproteobacteria bacterium RIFCSPLOWO2_01_FULL_42_9]
MSLTKKKKRNEYKHSMDLKSLKILNASRDDFRKKLEEIPYRGYEVEQLSDGRKIVIAKPGGKSVYGQPKKEDFFVWVYNPIEGTLWQITHRQIYEDLKLKEDKDASIALKAIDYLKRVHRGEEPEEILRNANIGDVPGEPIEILLKSYKWIWGQEDVNYPNGEGRDMSMKSILELENELQNEK